MGWEWREGQVEVSYKGPFARGVDQYAMPGGRTVAMPPSVAYSHSPGKRSFDFWFEDLGFRTLDLNALDPLRPINVFRMSPLIHPADNRLKLYVVTWRGDADDMRDLVVVRSPAFWVD